MRSARIVKPKQYLEIKQLETPKPEDSQVVMKVKSSAVCHSDVHLWEAG
jgi:alcohol dehydrogenase, propanol-preferring